MNIISTDAEISSLVETFEYVVAGHIQGIPFSSNDTLEQKAHSVHVDLLNSSPSYLRAFARAGVLAGRVDVVVDRLKQLSDSNSKYVDLKAAWMILPHAHTFLEGHICEWKMKREALPLLKRAIS